MFHRRHWIRRHPEVSVTAFCMAVHGSLLTREELKFDQFRENGIHSKMDGSSQSPRILACMWKESLPFCVLSVLMTWHVQHPGVSPRLCRSESHLHTKF